MLDLDDRGASRAALSLLTQWPPPVDADVPLVAWPADEALRVRLAAAGYPRLLVLAPNERPPDDWDDLEDWVRAPIDATEVTQRVATLKLRLRERTGGLHIDDGLLRRDATWIDLSATQLALTRLLLSGAGRPLGRPELTDVFRDAGGADNDRALVACLRRLRDRLEPMGIILHWLSDQRVLLEVTDPAAPTATT